jgi:hypothetical protein
LKTEWDTEPSVLITNEREGITIKTEKANIMSILLTLRKNKGSHVDEKF